MDRLTLQLWDLSISWDAESDTGSDTAGDHTFCMSLGWFRKGPHLGQAPVTLCSSANFLGPRFNLGGSELHQHSI